MRFKTTQSPPIIFSCIEAMDLLAWASMAAALSIISCDFVSFKVSCAKSASFICAIETLMGMLTDVEKSIAKSILEASAPMLDLSSLIFVRAELSTLTAAVEPA